MSSPQVRGCARLDEKSGIISFLVQCHTELSGWFVIQVGGGEPVPAYGSQLCGHDGVPTHHCRVCERLTPHYPSSTNKCKCLLAFGVYTPSV